MVDCTLKIPWPMILSEGPWLAMHISMQQEQFSKNAWVRALAAVAGYNITTCEVDDDSIDLGFAGNRRDGVDVKKSPKLDIQLKCRHQRRHKDPYFSYALKMKNYDDLRDPEVHAPRILSLSAASQTT